MPHEQRVLAVKKELPEFHWDSVSKWATAVFFSAFGPVLVQTLIFQLLKLTVCEDDLDAALTKLLVVFLVIGLALAGLGQVMQALAHGWFSPMGKKCGTGGVIIGVIGWAFGLLAGVLLPLVENDLPDPTSMWVDPTFYVFSISLAAPFLLWSGIVLVRPSLQWVAEFREMRSSGRKCINDR